MRKGEQKVSKIIKCLIVALCLSICCSMFAACGQEDKIEKTELDAPVIASAVYTGKNMTANIPASEGYTVVKNDGGIDVGEYDVVIKLSDSTKFAWKDAVTNEEGEITLKFVITKAKNAIESLTLENWAYGETANTPAVTAKFGTPTFTYSDTENGTFTETVPSAVGSYFVKATIAETKNYEGATKTATFSIEKTRAAFTTEPTAITGISYVEGTSNNLVTAGTSNDGTVEYKLNDGEWQTAIPTAENAGEYNVYYRVVGDSDHSNLEVEAPIVVTVAKVDATLTAPTAKTGLVYTGEALELVNAGTATGGTIQYKLNDGEYGTAIPTATAAGTYTVYYKVVGDANHNDIDEANVTVTIARATAKLTAPTAKTLTYTGEAQALVEAGTATGGTIQYKLGDGEYSEAIPTATAAGTYTVYYKVVGDANHNDIDEANVTVTIARATAKLTAPAAKTLTYTGEALELVNAGTATGGTIQYKLGNGEYSEAIPTAINAGDYTVYYKVVGDANHNDIDEANVTVTIARATATLTAPTAKTGLVYTGKALELVNAGSVTAGTLKYSLDGENYSTEVPQGTTADNYTVYYKVELDNNYNAIAEANVTVAIAKADNAITWERDGEGNIVGLDFTYGNEPNETTATATAGEITYTYTLVNADSNSSDLNVAEDATYSAWSNENTSGLYHCVITASETANYKSVTTERWVRVHKADNVITLSVASLDCNWGSGPDGTKATATYGTPVYTYWLSNSDSTGEVAEPGSDAVFKSWSEYNAVGVYKCRITVAESTNYKAGILEKWVRVHKKEQDENGVKYTYGDGAYYVSGYAGSNTEVTVASTFNDGANGEKSVTLVGENCAWGTDVTKIILPACITDFKGNSFQSATNLEYISMTGVTHISTGNNFINNQKITTVIVNKAFALDNQQFKMHGITADPTVVIYVDGTKAESTFAYVNKPGDGIGNEFLTGEVYYLGNGTDCLTWKFNEAGEIVKGASAHSFENGACKTCGADQTEGITYAVSGDTAYVVSYSGTATEVYVRSTYEDKPVTYVAQKAFENKTMKKVVLPESVTDLGGFVFHQCPNLEYVDARGVKNIQYANASARADGTNESNNNFRSCDKLTTVIIGDGFSSNVGQFTGSEKTINLYVYGSTAITTQEGDNVLTGVVYYLGDGTKCLTWKFDDDGNIVKGASAHSFEDGKCTACGIYNTQGVNYVYDSTNQCYYVGNNKTLNVSELTILSKYNDGTNGEHDVTYVAKGAFGDYSAAKANQYITKVILPETVTDLGGLAFASCGNLAYVDAKGVSTITYNRSDYTRPDGSADANNNFFGCTALTTVIIGDGFSSNVGQFTGGTGSSIALYVYGTTAATLQDGDSAVDKTKIYYYSETQPTDTAKTYWHYVGGVATVWTVEE